MEGIGFRDRIREFEAQNAQILGASTDPVAANAAFAKRFAFPFPLLCDTRREVCTAYGACAGPTDAEARRLTFVMGADGGIVQIHENVPSPVLADRVLETLREESPREESPAVEEQFVATSETISSACGCAVPSQGGERIMDEQSQEEERTLSSATTGPARSRPFSK